MFRSLFGQGITNDEMRFEGNDNIQGLYMNEYQDYIAHYNSNYSFTVHEINVIGSLYKDYLMHEHQTMRLKMRKSALRARTSTTNNMLDNFLYRESYSNKLELGILEIESTYSRAIELFEEKARERNDDLTIQPVNQLDPIFQDVDFKLYQVIISDRRVSNNTKYIAITKGFEWQHARKFVTFMSGLLGIELTEKSEKIAEYWCSGDWANYTEAYKVLLPSQDEMIKRVIDQVNKQAKRGIMNRLNSKVSARDDMERRMKGYYDRIADLEENIRMLNPEIFGLQTQGDQEDYTKLLEEFMDFINQHPHLSVRLDRNYSGNLVINMRAPLKFYEAGLAKKLIRDSSSVAERNKLIIRECFVEENYEMWVEVNLIIKLENRNFNAASDDSSSSITQFIPQGHLVYYNCWGDNHRHIQKALNEMDLIGMINMAYGAMMNLNLGDSAVMNRMYQVWNTSSKQALKDKTTGEFITISEMIQKIREQELEAERAKINQIREREEEAFAAAARRFEIEPTDPFEVIENIIEEEN